jgi:hypothetical protein
MKLEKTLPRLPRHSDTLYAAMTKPRENWDVASWAYVTVGLIVIVAVVHFIF